MIEAVLIFASIILLWQVIIPLIQLGRIRYNDNKRSAVQLAQRKEIDSRLEKIEDFNIPGWDIPTKEKNKVEIIGHDPPYPYKQTEYYDIYINGDCVDRVRSPYSFGQPLKERFKYENDFEIIGGEDYINKKALDQFRQAIKSGYIYTHKRDFKDLRRGRFVI